MSSTSTRLVSSASASANSLAACPSLMLSPGTSPPLEADERDAPSDKKKRKSAPKSKLGCITCKERHVKCDETRPGCKRCTRTGRICAGYVETCRKPTSLALRPRLSPKAPASPPATESPSSVISISPILSDFVGSNLSMQEMQSLEYFRIKAAMAFPGPFDGEFWTSILSQASRQEPCIRYAMVAVSSMHRHFLLNSDVSTTPSTALSKPATTLEYYNKAIAALSARIASGACSTSTTLMCCTLFIALETIQGDSEAFVSHVKNGQNLVIQWRTQQSRAHANPQSAASYNDDCLIEQHLVPFLAQQDAFANCFLNTDPNDVVSADKAFFKPVFTLPPAFRSLEESRDFLMQLNEIIIQFCQLNTGAKYTGTVSFEDVADLHRLQGKLRQWRATFKALCVRIAPLIRLNQTQLAISSLLNIQYHAMKVWLSAGLNPEQSYFDLFLDDFRAIVHLAPFVIDTQLRDDGAVRSLQNTQWGTALVPQLVLTAMLCRDPTTRRDALALLRRCAPRCGIWTQPVPAIAALIQRWIAIEEAAIPKPSTPPVPDDAVETIARLPPEHARIHFSRLVRNDHHGPERKTVEFHSRPWGPYGSWYVATEDVHV